MTVDVQCFVSKQAITNHTECYLLPIVGCVANESKAFYSLNNRGNVVSEDKKSMPSIGYGPNVSWQIAGTLLSVYYVDNARFELVHSKENHNHLIAFFRAMKNRISIGVLELPSVSGGWVSECSIEEILQVNEKTASYCKLKKLFHSFYEHAISGNVIYTDNGGNYFPISFAVVHKEAVNGCVSAYLSDEGKEFNTELLDCMSDASFYSFVNATHNWETLGEKIRYGRSFIGLMGIYSSSGYCLPGYSDLFNYDEEMAEALLSSPPSVLQFTDDILKSDLYKKFFKLVEPELRHRYFFEGMSLLNITIEPVRKVRELDNKFGKIYANMVSNVARLIL